jgi:hypothetical protein
VRFHGTKKGNENKIYHVSIFVCFCGLARYVKEVGEIISKMEKKNWSSPMKTFQGFVDQIFIT